MTRLATIRVAQVELKIAFPDGQGQSAIRVSLKYCWPLHLEILLALNAIFIFASYEFAFASMNCGF